MNDFLTWQYVGTFIGMCFCTGMVTEFTKELPFVKKIPTKYFTAIIAFILLLFSNITGGTFNLINIPIIMLNSILICFTSTGGYDFHYRKTKVVEDKDSDVEVD